MSNIEEVPTETPRFFVQNPHFEGLAVLDRKTGSLVISSFGDTGELAEEALKAVAAALNAATNGTYPNPTDEYKRLSIEAPSLQWRVIDYLASLYQAASESATAFAAAADELKWADDRVEDVSIGPFIDEVLKVLSQYPEWAPPKGDK